MPLPFKPGDRLAEIRLGSMGGTSVTLGDFPDRKKLIYVWASWSGSREHLGELQKFHLAHPGVTVISIACDAQGVDLPMKYVAMARSTHEIWIDATCHLVRRWKLKQEGVLILADENDVVLWESEEAPGPMAFEAVEKLLAQAPEKSPPPRPKPDTKNTKLEFLVQLCTNYLTRKRVDDAVGFLKQALALDPANGILPRQILALRNPEKFYSGPIDLEWQKSQPPVLS
jgi:hypothetical protein